MDASLTLGIARPEPVSGRRAVKTSFKPPVDLAFMTAKHLPRDLKETVLKRDDNTCHYCEFQAEKYQTIHHLDHDLENIAADNLVTACMFCHQCFHLNHVATMESGMLVWLPELPQTTLNDISRAIYVGRISQGEIAEAARQVYDVLMTRREVAMERVGTDNPYILSSVLQDYLGPKAYAARAKKLEGLRLFPLDKRMVQEGELSFNQFPQVLAYWRSKKGPFGGKAPAQWIAITQKLIASA